MATHSLPMPASELAQRLSRALAPQLGGPELSVADPLLVQTPAGLGLAVRVTVTTTGAAWTQTWQVTIPIDVLDIHPEVQPESFVITMRANLEEWWAMKGVEPAIAAWGHRLG